MHALLRGSLTLLLLALAGFALLFVSEARAAKAGLEAQRQVRREHANQALGALVRSTLDVAEARIAVSRDVPGLDVRGLLRIDADGLERLPGDAGVHPAGDGGAELVDGWLLEGHDGEVHGAALDPVALLAALGQTLRDRGTLEAGDALMLTASAPPSLEVHSPSLQAEARAADRALVFKLALLVLTAGLGIGVLRLERRAAREREETLRLQREFVSAVSHELRTPLAAIRLMAETLERRLPPDGPARDYPHRLVSAADRLSLLVENVLSFSRLDAGKVVPALQPFDWATVQRWLDEDAALLDGGPIDVHTRGLETLAPSRLDATLARLLVSNLFRNAAAYGRSTDGVLRFDVHATQAPEGLHLHFVDEGPGIPPHEAARVFEPFARLDRTDAPGGTGLGLAVARQVARLHGGDLTCVASTRGAHFVWVVPGTH